jgi:hypothetical protein
MLCSKSPGQLGDTILGIEGPPQGGALIVRRDVPTAYNSRSFKLMEAVRGALWTWTWAPVKCR